MKSGLLVGVGAVLSIQQHGTLSFRGCTSAEVGS